MTNGLQKYDFLYDNNTFPVSSISGLGDFNKYTIKGVNPCYKVGGTFSQLVRGTYPTKFIDSCLSNLIKVDP